jgi:hypothetical protein
MNTTTGNGKRFWFFNKANRLMVGGLEFESFADARRCAAQYNKDGPHATLGYVEFISDAPSIAGGRITTVCPPLQLSLTEAA